MRLLDSSELDLVSGGKANFDVRPGTKPSDAAPDMPGNRVGWCWGLGNLGGSAGKGKGLTLPKHEGADCGCGGDDSGGGLS